MPAAVPALKQQYVITATKAASGMHNKAMKITKYLRCIFLFALCLECELIKRHVYNGIAVVLARNLDRNFHFYVVQLDDVALATVVESNLASHLGHELIDFDIIVVFVTETAHQVTAQPVYLRRVYGDALVFRHFDRYSRIL